MDQNLVVRALLLIIELSQISRLSYLIQSHGLYSFTRIVNSVRYSVRKSYLRNIEVQNENKAFVA